MKFKLLLLSFLICSNGWAAVDFDVTDDFINMGSSGSWESDSSGTISAWIYADTFTAGNGVRVILGYGGDNVATPGILDFSIRKNSGVFTGARFDITQASDTGGVVAGWYGSTQLSEDTWYHVVFASSGTLWAIVVNGIDETMAAWTDAGAEGNDGDWFSDSPASNSSTYIGAVKFDGTVQGFFDGKIEEVSIWSSAIGVSNSNLLSASKLRKISCQIAPSTLRVSWPIDQCADGTSCNSLIFNSICGQNVDFGTGDNGANDTGLTGVAGEILTYP